MIDKYVEKIKALWNPDQRVLDALKVNKLVVEQKLAPYYWDDVELTLEEYFARVDSRQYPRVEQIIARLNANKAPRKSEKESGGIPIPGTNIRLIQGVYLTVVRWGHKEGVWFSPYCAYVEHIQQGNKAYIKETRLPDGRVDEKLCNKRWDLVDFIKRKEDQNPGVFEPFVGLELPEKVAILVSKGLMKLN